jgi:hypothetical protein
MSDDTVACCPSCGSSNIRTRSPGKPAQRSHVHDEKRHYCRDCQTPTDRLERREKDAKGSRHGDAETLANLDASDVPALSEGEP